MSTLELLIAFSIFTLIIGGAAIISFGNQAVALDTSLANQAIYQARTSLENFKTTLTTNNWDETSLPAEISVADISNCVKNITSSIKWQTTPLRPQTTDLFTALTNPVEAINLGGDCILDAPFGDWRNLNISTSLGIVPSTNPASDIDTVEQTTYLTVNPSAASDADFFIIKDGKTISSLDTGPGLNALDATARFAYVANGSRNAQLQIIDISDDSAPTVKKSYKLPGTYTDATIGNSIFYYRSRVYLGTNKSQLGEFHIIDVANPSSPSELGSWEVGAGVNAIYVKGNYAYLATPNDEELTVLDISDPSAIKRVGGFNAPKGSGNGKSVKVVGNKLYLGRTVGSNEFYILDISDPTNPQELGFYNLNSSINDLVVAGNYAFLATSQVGGELQVLDLTDPAKPNKIGQYDYSNKASGIDFANNQLYLSNKSGDALKIISPNL